MRIPVSENEKGFFRKSQFDEVFYFERIDDYKNTDFAKNKELITFCEFKKRFPYELRYNSFCRVKEINKKSKHLITNQ